MSVRIDGFRVQTEGTKPWKVPVDRPWEKIVRTPEGPAEIRTCLECENENCTGSPYCRRILDARKLDKEEGLARAKVRKIPIPKNFRRLYLHGVECKEIAERYNVSTSLVQRWARNLGLQRPEKGADHAESDKNLQPGHAGKARRRTKAAGKKQAAGK